MAKVSDSVPGRLDALPDVLFVEDLATVFRCSPSTIRRRLGARARDPHAAGRGQAPAVQPRSR